PLRAATNRAAASGKHAERSTAGTRRSLSRVVPPNADRSTCAKVRADARSGGVLSAERQSGFQTSAKARAGEEAKRAATDSSVLSGNPAFWSLRNPAMRLQRSRHDRPRAESAPRARLSGAGAFHAVSSTESSRGPPNGRSVR